VADLLLRRARAILARGSARSLPFALLALALAACGASAGQASPGSRRAPGSAAGASARAAAGAPVPAASPRLAEAPCGAAAAQTRAAAALSVGRRIYDREVSSPEVSRDQRQVEAYGPLLSALAAGDRAAVKQAVTSLVFSHTHMVRLRVSRGGAVLADVGGPFILAPVGGALRSGGRNVGHYVLSVQDDSGYAKLEARYIGAPLVMRQRARRLPVEGTIGPGGAAIPDSGPVRYRGASYQVVSFTAAAFPSGALRISLLLPTLASSTASCAKVRAAELSRIAHLMWNRFMLIGAPVSAYVTTAHSLVGVLSYVRSGSRQLAGSTSPGPAHLPAAGTVKYHGRTYHVTSFAGSAAGGSVRVYQLVAP
jgi:hypothetical protein